jgi:hypothetical protein
VDDGGLWPPRPKGSHEWNVEMPAPTGNKNALKHGLYASKAALVVDGPSTSLRSAQGDTLLRGPSVAIQYLDEAIDEIFKRLMRARGEEFTRLANALSLATTALFNGHRTMAYLTGGMTPVEDAMKELEALDFGED